MINRQTVTILNLYLQANDEVKQEIEEYFVDLANDRKSPKMNKLDIIKFIDLYINATEDAKKSVEKILESHQPPAESLD